METHMNNSAVRAIVRKYNIDPVVFEYNEAIKYEFYILEGDHASSGNYIIFWLELEFNWDDECYDDFCVYTVDAKGFEIVTAESTTELLDDDILWFFHENESFVFNDFVDVVYSGDFLHHMNISFGDRNFIEKYSGREIYIIRKV